MIGLLTDSFQLAAPDPRHGPICGNDTIVKGRLCTPPELDIYYRVCSCTPASCYFGCWCIPAVMDVAPLAQWHSYNTLSRLPHNESSIDVQGSEGSLS